MTEKDICIIGNVNLFNNKYFTDSAILKGQSFCGNTNIESNNIADTQIFTNWITELEPNLYYTEGVWASFALNRGKKRIICFEIPNRGLPIFKYYGITSRMVLISKQKLDLSLQSFLNLCIKKRMNRGMKLFNPIKSSYQINELLNKCNIAIFRFTIERFEIIYHDIDIILKK
jgi:hypothetical protein